MSGLHGYLAEKREAVRAHREAGERGERSPLLHQRATTTVEGRTGVRRIRVDEFSVAMDSGPGGYSLGPSSQELLLGAVSSCLSHSFLINAAVLEVSLDEIEVEVTATQDERAGSPSFEDVPVYPSDVAYVVRITSHADPDDIRILHEAVQRSCPLLNLVRAGQPVTGYVDHVRPTAPQARP